MAHRRFKKNYNKNNNNIPDDTKAHSIIHYSALFIARDREISFHKVLRVIFEIELALGVAI